jgi:predicted aspartyl protease
MCVAAVALLGAASAADVKLELSGRGFPLVEVALNGQGPFTMVLDTAAGITTVSTPLIERLDLLNVGRMPQPVQLAGGPQTVDLYTLGFVTLGGEKAPAPITVVLDAPLNYIPRAQGILGMNVLSRFALDIDQPNGRMIVHPPGATPDQGADWSIVPIAPRWDSFLVIDLTIAGQPAKAVIDTGANETILNAKLRDALGIVEGGPGVSPGTIALASTPSLKVRIGPIKAGETTWPDLGVQAADLPLFKALGLDETPALVLGNDALKQVRLFVDYAGDRVYLTKPPAAPLLGEVP